MNGRTPEPESSAQKSLSVKRRQGPRCGFAVLGIAGCVHTSVFTALCARALELRAQPRHKLPCGGAASPSLGRCRAPPRVVGAAPRPRRRRPPRPRRRSSGSACPTDAAGACSRVAPEAVARRGRRRAERQHEQRAAGLFAPPGCGSHAAKGLPVQRDAQVPAVRAVDAARACDRPRAGRARDAGGAVHDRRRRRRGPISAAVQWVLKDGVGHAAAIGYGTAINTRFDADANATASSRRARSPSPT